MRRPSRPAQEVYLDRKAYPWWPDVWHMSGILSGPAGAAEAGPRGPGAQDSSGSLLPKFSAFEMLQTPLMAHGAGLQFKRAPDAASHARQQKTALCHPTSRNPWLQHLHVHMQLQPSQER